MIRSVYTVSKRCRTGSDWIAALPSAARSVTAAIITLLVVLAGTASAWSIDLEAGQPIGDLGSSLAFLDDGGQSLKEVVAAFESGRFSRDIETFQSGASTFNPVWIAVPVSNRSDDDDREPASWFLTSSTPMLSAMEIYLVRGNGPTETLLDYAFDRPFDAGQFALTSLIANPVTLQPNETALVLIYYQPSNLRTVRLRLETAASLSRRTIQAGIGYAAFYAFSIACLVFFAGFNVSMGNRNGLYFAALFALGLLVIAHVDGFLIRFAWPNTPEVKFYAGYLLSQAMAAIGFLAAGRATEVERWGNVPRRLGIGLALVCLGFMLVTPFVSPSVILLPTYVLFGLSFSANILATAIWRKTSGRLHTGANIVAAVSAIGVITVIAMLITGYGLQLAPFHILMKLIYSLISLATMIGLTSYLILLRTEHNAALVRENRALALEAERNQALLEAEKNYSRARDLANLRQNQLASASHDLRQPLASLRLTMETIAGPDKPEIRKRLRDAFDYMEGLTTSYLADSKPEFGSSPPEIPGIQETNVPVAQDSREKAEPYEIGLILRTLFEMFHEEAISKGLRLRKVDCSCLTDIPPMAVMRIVSNLVSNAIKYTESGAVLFGCRRVSGNTRIEVHDTGPGLSQEMLANLLRPYQKGDASTGEGLGLAICSELAREYRLCFEGKPGENGGMCFSLLLPGR